MPDPDQAALTSVKIPTCADKVLLALLCVMFSCVFATFPYGVLDQVWCLIVSIYNLCLLPYFDYWFILFLFSYGLYKYERRSVGLHNGTMSSSNTRQQHDGESRHSNEN